MNRSPTELLADVRDFLLALDQRQGTVLDGLAYDIDAALEDLDYRRSWEWKIRASLGEVWDDASATATTP